MSWLKKLLWDTVRFSEIDDTLSYPTVPLLRAETWEQGNAEYLWSYALRMLLRGIHYSAPSKAIVRLWCGLAGEHNCSHRPPRQFYRSECTSVCIILKKVPEISRSFQLEISTHNSLVWAGNFFKVMGMPQQDEAKIDLKLKLPGL